MSPRACRDSDARASMHRDERYAYARDMQTLEVYTSERHAYAREMHMQETRREACIHHSHAYMRDMHTITACIYKNHVLLHECTPRLGRDASPSLQDPAWSALTDRRGQGCCWARGIWLHF